MGKFKIPENPPTVNKTIRFPNDVVEDVERAIQGKDCTFSAFVIAAVRAALEDLKNQKGRKSNDFRPFLCQNVQLGNIVDIGDLLCCFTCC